MTGSETRVLRYADWTISPERDASGHLLPPERAVQCKDCDAAYKSSEQIGTDQWALQHTGLTGHRRYRELVEAPLIVRPAPTNPLAEQETTS
ncbi:MAG: hypothetical protein J2P25_14480 [Nocardiopsaceae bacterium]|nr:hypothetical protein [Nocardiopsaceae bacterium]